MMNKYQESLIKTVKNMSLMSEEGRGIATFDGDNLVLTQNENYGIVDYVLSFDTDAVETVELDEIKVSGGPSFKFQISFLKRPSKIKFTFKNNLADPCVMEIKYIEADKKAYDDKIAEKTQKELLEKLNACIRVGNNLVNIHWNKAVGTYPRTTLTLFAVIDENEMFMESYQLENGECFKAITGLAFGKYKVRIEQYERINPTRVSLDLIFKIEDEIKELNKSLSDKLKTIIEQRRAWR